MLASALCGPGQDKVQTGQLQGKGIKKKKNKGGRCEAREYFNLWQFDSFSMLRAVNFCAPLSSRSILIKIQQN